MHNARNAGSHQIIYVIYAASSRLCTHLVVTSWEYRYCSSRKLNVIQARETADKGASPVCGGENSLSGCVGVGTAVDDAFQTLNHLDQRRHVGDFIQWRGLQLCQQGTDLLLRNAIEDDLHATQT